MEVGCLGLVICTISALTLRDLVAIVGFRIVDENDQPIACLTEQKIIVGIPVHFSSEASSAHAGEDSNDPYLFT